MFYSTDPLDLYYNSFNNNNCCGIGKARVCATTIHFNSSLIFAGKVGAYQNRAPYRTPLYW
jgi:hypothetical protein